MDFRESARSAPETAVDPRYATARDAAIRSFFHRFGRAPTEDEFRQSIEHFMPAGESVYADSDLAPLPYTDTQDPPRAAEYEARAVRFYMARDAAIQSFRNRLGRDPSVDELREALPNYLVPGDREAITSALVNDAALLAGFKVPGPPQNRPPPPGKPRPPQEIIAAKALLSAMLEKAKGLTTDSPLAQGALALRVIPEMVPKLVEELRQQRLKSLGVDPAQADAESADPSDIQMLLGRLQDVVRGWDGRSFDVYGKERLDEGPCIYSIDPKTGKKTCVYIGHTSGRETPEENVRRRFLARHPNDSYRKPELHRSTSSYGAAIGEEGRGIDYYRRLNRSDNTYRAYSPYSPLAAYYRLKALQEFGPFEPPIR